MRNKTKKLQGTITVPGDKSISHRAIMFGSIAFGMTEVGNFLRGADCLSTIDCFRKLGIQIEETSNRIFIHGKGLHGLTRPNSILDAGNSGTTTRLISGILAAQNFTVTLTGDASIQKRPMGRIITPLSQMGADITSINQNQCAPLLINGQNLHGIEYHSPVASAQVKSAILLAGLYADSDTSVTEPFVSRNHTEIMLQSFGAPITTSNTTAKITPGSKLSGQKVEVPGDISSAAYFLVAGLITPNSEILIQNVGINPTRDGILRVIKMMGGNLKLENSRIENGEEVADLLVSSSQLQGIEIGGSLIPTLIDEIPVIAVMAAYAKGQTVIKDAAELKVKESNRIDVMVQNLSAMGAHIEATEDGMIIDGGFPLIGTHIESHLDHRIAMSFAIAGLNASGEMQISKPECVDVSYPNFFKDLASLQV